MIHGIQYNCQQQKGNSMKITRIGMKTMDHYFEEYEAKLAAKYEAELVKQKADQAKRLRKAIKLVGK
tara:strand:- start:47 stop:247 length:201 start_codon:yes stop_codon:yes gene_type:complete